MAIEAAAAFARLAALPQPLPTDHHKITNNATPTLLKGQDYELTPGCSPDGLTEVQVRDLVD
jgi:hypothetical protein